MDTNERMRVYRAMRSASRSGFDPYNSHTVQAAKWLRAARDAARRAKS